MKVLLTESGGRIGRAIVARLQADGTTLATIDRDSTALPTWLGDVGGVAVLQGAMRSVDMVIHTAALHAPYIGKISDTEFERINIDATKTLLNAAMNAGLQRIIYTRITALYLVAIYAQQIFLSNAPTPLAMHIFKPGFRISTLDYTVLLLGAIASIAALQIDHAIAGVTAFTVGHFFLFCNVLRMNRTYEIIWAAGFISLAGATIYGIIPSWWACYGVTTLTTGVVVTLQLRRPDYHGAFWQQTNPNLRVWWEINFPP